MATAIDFIFNVRDSLSPVLDRINQKQKKLAYDIAYMQNKTVGGWSRLAQEQEKFKKRTDVSANSISDLRTKIEQLTRTRDLSVSYQQIREANAEISKLQRQLQRLENLPPKGFMSNLSSTGKLLMGAFGAFALNAIRSYTTEFISSSVTLSNQMKAIDGAIRFAGGSEGSKNLAFVQQEIERLGVPAMQTKEAYKQLSGAFMGTKLAGEPMNQLFTSILSASQAMGLNGEAAQGAILALGQMMSKGKVSAEELRGQLGERLPGAFQIAARSMGVTTQELDKLLSDGKVMSEDFLPKFALELQRTFGAQAETAAQSLSANLNRLQNRFESLKIGIGNALEPIVNRFAILGITLIDKVMPYVEQLPVYFAIISQWVEALSAGISTATMILVPFGVSWAILNANLIATTVALKLTSAAQWLLNTAMMANPAYWVVGGIVALGMVLAYLYQKFDFVRGAIWGVWEGLKELGSIILENIITGFQALGELLEGIFTLDWDKIKSGFTKGIQTLIKSNPIGFAIQNGERIGKATAKGYADGLKDFEKDQTIGISKETASEKAFSTNIATSPVSAPSAVSQGIEKISAGGSRPTTINISIGKFQDQLVIHAATLRESADEIQRVLEETLLRVANSVSVN